jgi:two-component system, chemotaxis family, chemotaxis protein CheY
MKTLIVEDDPVSRMVLKEMLKDYGYSDCAVNGREGVNAVRAALDSGRPYNLICLDILMPEMDGQEALMAVRQLEQERDIGPSREARIIMTTSLDDAESMKTAFDNFCDGYLTKPIRRTELLEKLHRLRLIP